MSLIVPHFNELRSRKKEAVKCSLWTRLNAGSIFISVNHHQNGNLNTTSSLPQVGVGELRRWLSFEKNRWMNDLQSTSLCYLHLFTSTSCCFVLLHNFHGRCLSLMFHVFVLQKGGGGVQLLNFNTIGKVKNHNWRTRS